MISKKMYRILKAFPSSPNTITLKNLREQVNIDINEMWSILEDALGCNYIAYASRNPYNDILQSPLRLTEAGQIEIEEYCRTSNSSAKATWALVIAGLSLLVSIGAIILSFCGVQ